MKSLLVLDHAPDYREEFLRELGGLCDLTVVAQPCEQDNLTPPVERKGYTYMEIPSIRLAGFVWQPGLRTVISKSNWDVVCVGINIRHLSRVSSFLSLPSTRKKWVWRGHVFGRNKSRLLNLFRGYLLRHASGCLAYSELERNQVNDAFGVGAVSFNNTEVRSDEFRFVSKDFGRSGVRLLFVGRYHDRKKLGRLVDLVWRRPDVFVRLVGPGMENVNIPEDLSRTGRLEVYGKTSGEDLNIHFDWADMVANPGHVGLLVMNAARHHKGIVIDSSSNHAPEFWLAKESKQPFIDFREPREIDQFLDKVLSDRTLFKFWGDKLQEVCRRKYTIEHMASAHMNVFQDIASSNN